MVPELSSLTWDFTVLVAVWLMDSARTQMEGLSFSLSQTGLPGVDGLLPRSLIHSHWALIAPWPLSTLHLIL